MNYQLKQTQYGGYFDVESKEKQIKKLEKETLDNNFWNRGDSNDILKKLGDLKKSTDDIKRIKEELEAYKELIEIDESYKNDLHDTLEELSKKVNLLELETKLSGEYDSNNAFLELHSGAGGTEACDWVSMLLRMYTRYAEKNNYKVEVIDELPGEEAGLKKVTLLIKGLNAYGYLKGERGVHRLVRISPFDSNKRRHTSFASVEVTPEVDDSINIEIKEQDLRIDVYRSTGAGGQGVNTTDSAVRITHIPTGIVVTFQDERSQLKNKIKALGILKARIYDEMQRKQEAEVGAERRSKIGTGDRSEKIRTYNYPQNRVTDHRINLTLMQLDRIMQGKMDELIEALINEDIKRKLAGE